MKAKLRATYRVQISPTFDLDRAAEIAGYLAALGISHFYSSPYLQAAAGSTHGYDVVNHHQVNEVLGGAQARARLIQALDDHNLGQVLDIVPNHMAITGRENPWWWDVLENGPSSLYASYFDVDWDPPEARHSNVVLTPVLGEHYGQALEARKIYLHYENNEFTIRYSDHEWPVDPRSLSSVLASAATEVGSDELMFLAEAYGGLPLATATDRASARRRHRDRAVLKKLLSDLVRGQPKIEEAIQAAVYGINMDVDRLGALLDEQNYRLAYWRITERELGYRRFFDINTLIGLRMEDEAVYVDSHALILSWLEAGQLDGLRIDHPDGLRDPEKYLHRLHDDSPDTWIVVEKIVEPGEELPVEWPVAGTTGYDFLNLVNGLFIDPQGEQPLTEFYTRFTGENADWPEICYLSKKMATIDVLGSDLNRLTQLMLQVIERHRSYRDYTRHDLREMLQEVAACLPVYRTYVRPLENQIHPADVSYIQAAIEAAKQRREDIEPRLFDFFEDLLMLRVDGEVESELVMRFQQFTGPVMAKGVEDTAFYNFNRLVSLNEVGGDPGRFGVSTDEFHQAARQIQERWPLTMLSTSTHDTKRSEDVRARINVLSEVPEAWIAAVTRWGRRNQRYRVGEWPDRNTEYLLYQTLVGAWPVSQERILQYIEKAAREAKRYTSWSSPNEDFEEALAGFVRSIFADQVFVRDLEAFAMSIREAGRVNSLAQTLIKLTAPGIPDIYQGTELWDLSLVDPDNRRPVNFDLRRRLLEGLAGQPQLERILTDMEGGLPKLWVIHQALQVRYRLPEVFGPESSYQALAVRGDHAIAFLRGGLVATVAPRLVGRRERMWGQTVVELPDGKWKDQLTGEVYPGGELRLGDLLHHFPVALLVREQDPSMGEGD